jgi:hypothetical protein
VLDFDCWYRGFGLCSGNVVLEEKIMGAKPFALAGVLALAASVACSSSGPSGPAGGPASGAADTHCSLPDGGTTIQVTSQASCNIIAGGDAGAADYGATMFNAEGDDDDCKYHVKWSSTAIYENTNVTFTVVATYKGDGGVVTGANIDPEVFLGTTHPAPNEPTKAVENPPGTYSVGPIQFDEAGQWTVRWHLFETCDDTVDDSPHGHAAFFVDVP